MNDGLVESGKSVHPGVHLAPLRSRDEQDLHSGKINIKQYLESARNIADSEVHRSVLDRSENHRLDRLMRSIRLVSLSVGFLLAIAYLISGLVIYDIYPGRSIAYLSLVTGVAVGAMSLVFAVLRKR